MNILAKLLGLPFFVSVIIADCIAVKHVDFYSFYAAIDGNLSKIYFVFFYITIVQMNILW